jgi:hypothetical protein
MVACFLAAAHPAKIVVPVTGAPLAFRRGMRLAALVTVLATSATARADGFFYQQSYGVSSARGDARPYVHESLQLRIALGWRFGPVQVGPFLGSHLAWSRDDAYFDFIGGDPEMGDSDIEVYGLDAKYNAAIAPHLSAYVRGGPRYANGLGALDGYQGFGVGTGAGVALTGRVSALGFLFLPLFASNKGPKVTATLFFDYNVEWHQLDGGAMGSLSMPLVGTSIGFGAGSFF